MLNPLNYTAGTPMRLAFLGLVATFDLAGAFHFSGSAFLDFPTRIHILNPCMQTTETELVLLAVF